MLDADELDELRALQARAYGRVGGLSGLDEVRLRELTMRRSTEPRTVPRTEHRSAEPPLIDTVPKAAAASEVATASPSDAPPPAPAPTGRPDRPSRPLLRAVSIVAALIVALVIGVGAGWALSTPESPREVALTAEQQQWQRALDEAGDYDAGSLRAQAQQDDVVLWSATRLDGAQSCLLIGNGVRDGASCRLTQVVREEGLSLTVTQVGEQSSGQISGRMLLTLDDEPAASLDLFRYDTDVDGLGTSYANQDERRFAAGLVEQGFSRSSISVIGYDGENPIWSAFLPGQGRNCLFYTVLPDASWGNCTDAADARPWVERVDAQTGLTTRVTWVPASPTGASLIITTTESADDVAGE